MLQILIQIGIYLNDLSELKSLDHGFCLDIFQSDHNLSPTNFSDCYPFSELLIMLSEVINLSDFLLIPYWNADYARGL